jgi:hypothetical protein
MKKINLKNPRYVLPVLCLPFIILLFFIFRAYAAKGDKMAEREKGGLQSGLAGVSAEVSGQKLQDKLQAFEERYRKSDAPSALSQLGAEEPLDAPLVTDQHLNSQKMLDSIESVIRSRYGQSGTAPDILQFPQKGERIRDAQKRSKSALQGDRAIAKTLEEMGRSATSPENRDLGQDPMAVFRAQMAIVDSIGRAGGSSMQTGLERPGLLPGAAKKQALPQALRVRMDSIPQGPGTAPGKLPGAVNIPVMIDEQITGRLGSRMRMRLLADIRAGKLLIKKGTTLFGNISSFSAQRIGISVSSVLLGGEILPLNLEAYDLDGMKGIYVPSSAFRDLGREIGSSSSQGLTIDGAMGENKQLMSVMGRVFQSASGAFTRLVRQNKAKIKYGTLLYLVDPNELSSRQKNL